MTQVGICGIGDMGSGMAANLIKAGFEVKGFDPSPARAKAFEAMGGKPCESAAQVGEGSDIVFVMVMAGAHAHTAIFGSDEDAGLVKTMPDGGIVVLTSTIKPREAEALARELPSRLSMIDSPVSGGRPGAEGGALTLMAAGTDADLEKAKGPMEAISKVIHRCGDRVGQGQVVKACLQSLIGAIFAGTYEACGLAAKAGVPGEVLHKVFSTSAAGCGIVNGSIENIMNRKFEDTGSHINTMHKDITISLDLAMELGVPLFTASTAMQLFQAGRAKFPDGDNQVVARVTEDIIAAELRK